MKRSSHTLKRNEKVILPKAFIFFDIETKPKKLDDGSEEEEFFLGWGCYWRRRSDGGPPIEEWFFFTSRGEFWDKVVSKTYSKETLRLVAHNISFDLLGLRGGSNLARRGYKLSSFYEKERAVIVTVKNEKRKIQLLDNQNWFPGSLAKWGKIIGLEKIEVDFATCTDEELSEHCKRDVEIMLELHKWWFNIIIENDLGSWGVTLASQAFNAFRHRFMKHDIFILANDEVTKIEREAYFGGRCTPFFHGKINDGEVFHLDVNSMYPSVMRDNYFPAGFVSYKKKCSKKRLKELLERYCIIARVKVHPTEPVFPHRLDDRIIYPTYEFKTTLSTSELKYALKRDWIIEVYDTLCYRRAKLFTEYVDYFYRMKREAERVGNKVVRNMAKLLLNSLYGKFGQYSHKYEIVGDCDVDRFEVVREYDYETGRSRWIYYCFGKVMVKGEKTESYNAFPAIAAHVTAYARMYLWNLVKKCGKKNCYYCDTDSVFVNENGLRALKDRIAKDRLGFLKIKEKGKYFVIYAAKDYIFEQHERHKGIRYKARRLADGVYIQEKFPSLTGAMSRYAKEGIIVQQEVKKLKREVKWGWRDEEGWIHPFTSPPSSSRSPP